MSEPEILWITELAHRLSLGIIILAWGVAGLAAWNVWLTVRLRRQGYVPVVRAGREGRR